MLLTILELMQSTELAKPASLAQKEFDIIPLRSAVSNPGYLVGVFSFLRLKWCKANVGSKLLCLKNSCHGTYL